MRDTEIKDSTLNYNYEADVKNMKICLLEAVLQNENELHMFDFVLSDVKIWLFDYQTPIRSSYPTNINLLPQTKFIQHFYKLQYIVNANS